MHAESWLRQPVGPPRAVGPGSSNDSLKIWVSTRNGRAWPRQQGRRGQRLRRGRQSTVEPVLGNRIHHDDLRRMNVRGHAGAHKTLLLKAVALQLQKAAEAPPCKAAAPGGGLLQAAEPYGRPRQGVIPVLRNLNYLVITSRAVCAPQRKMYSPAASPTTIRAALPEGSTGALATSCPRTSSS